MSALESPAVRAEGSGVAKRRLKIGVKQVDAFTETPLTGNPAGVVPDAKDLTEQQMQAIAKEMSLSETAFILPPSTSAAHVRIRWFTPTVEVPLCGHATIASFHALAEDGRLGMDAPGRYAFEVETASGILPVRVEKRQDVTETYFGLPVPEFVRAGQYKLDVMRILNISLEEFENRMPIVVAGSLYVPIRRLHTIFSLKPNLFAMAQFLANKNLEGLCVFTTETVDRASAVHSRYFAPTAGINEDPVTGSANGPLGVYLFEREEVQASGDIAMLVGEQGDAIGRRGRVNIRLTVRGSEVVAVEVGGRAVTVLQGEMLIG